MLRCVCSVCCGVLHHKTVFFPAFHLTRDSDKSFFFHVQSTVQIKLEPASRKVKGNSWIRVTALWFMLRLSMPSSGLIIMMPISGSYKNTKARRGTVAWEWLWSGCSVCSKEIETATGETVFDRLQITVQWITSHSNPPVNLFTAWNGTKIWFMDVRLLCVAKWVSI